MEPRLILTCDEFNASLEGLLPCTVLLAITTGDDRPRVLHNGSGMLLDTGVAEMLVTNGHVYDKFLQLREADPTTRLSMSGTEGVRFLDISPAKVRGKETDPDLATLAVSRRQIAGQGKQHARFTPWPLRRAEVGMRGFLIGYPGDGLTVTGSYAGMRLLSFGMPIASSSERHFLLHDENCDIVRAAAPDAPPLTRLCGISGCAVYVWDAATDECFLGGFAYEGGGTDIVFAAHADYINPDGSIR